MTSSAERVVVTGAAGFIGAHLVRRLLMDGDDVVAIVRPGANVWRLADVADDLEIVEADVGTLAGATSLGIGHADVVHHLAAAGVSRIVEDGALIQTNVIGTVGALQLAAHLGARRFVYSGSCFEYGSGELLAEDAPLAPRSPYGASKAAAGLLARELGRARGLQVVWLRPFTAYGPFEAAHRLVPSTILGSLDGVAIELTSGEQRRDFVYVEDVAAAFAAAARADAAAGGIFNVCTGAAHTVADVAGAVARRCGGAELRFGSLAKRATDTDVLTGDPGRAADVLGWRAETVLEEGLRSTLDWFREHRRLYDRIEAPA